MINTLLIIIGIVLATTGLKGFLLPNHFIDGGITGLSMLVAQLLDKPLHIVILLINLPFVLLGLTQRSFQFATKSMLAIVGLSLSLFFLEVPALTQDKLLAAIFGGLFLGGGIGLTIRGGGVLDGTEILALFATNKYHLSIGDIIMAFNTVLFSVGAFFLGFEASMYSIITYFSASKTIDFLIYGLDEHVGVWIVSSKHSDIKSTVLSKLNKGVTMIKGEGGFSGNDQSIIFCVIAKLEVAKFKSTVATIDPEAFVMMHKISYTFGGITKKPVLHH